MNTNGWIEVNRRTPQMIKGKDYSENVLVVCDGILMVMCYGYVNDGEDGGWVWSNCYGDINGDPQFDDQYKPTHWQPLPKLPQ